VFVLARHAHAGDKQRWPGLDDDRPLTALGRNQAAHLVDLLADVPIRRLVSSPIVRCRQTLEPLAQARGLEVEQDARLEPDADSTRIEQLLVDAATDGAVLCTHGELMDRLLTRWTDERWVRFDGHEPGGTAKGAAWVVEDFGTPRASARYVPAVPPPPDA